MKWSSAMLLFCSLAAHADIVTLDDLGVEAQQRETWCYAAVSVMAIRSFPEQGNFQHLTQVQVVARDQLKITSLSEAQTRAIEVQGMETTCAMAGHCEIPDFPLLLGIDSDTLSSNVALSMQALSLDIKGVGRAGHPVIIQWYYIKTAASSANAPQGAHALLITGYNDSAQMVRIFNPMPIGSTRIKKHQKWIPYAKYLKPVVDEGATVFAQHVGDRYRMRRPEEQTQPLDDSDYLKVVLPDVSAPVLELGGFETPDVLRPAISQGMRSQVFLNDDGSPRTAQLSTGRPIPIVAIGGDDLIQAGAHPEALLVRRTAAYIVPVIEGTEVVDSFLLLKENGKWHEGGYSNNQIASLAAEIRDKNAHQFPNIDEFYVVSIPAAASFFVAHGFQAQAMLNSLAYEGRDGFMPANKALLEAAAKAREFADDKQGTSRVVTPRPTSPR